MAKEAEIQQILKGPPKRASKSQATPSSQNSMRSQQSPNSNPNASPQSRLALPNVPTALQYMSLQQKASSLLSQPYSIGAAATGSSSNNSSDETPARPGSPLDLSSSMPAAKRVKLESPSPNRSLASPTSQQSRVPATSAAIPPAAAGQRRCHAQNDELSSWTVHQVCEFVAGIDICSEYAEVSRIFTSHPSQRAAANTRGN